MEIGLRNLEIILMGLNILGALKVGEEFPAYYKKEVEKDFPHLTRKSQREVITGGEDFSKRATDHIINIFLEKVDQMGISPEDIASVRNDIEARIEIVTNAINLQ